MSKDSDSDKISAIHECIIELRTELRSPGGLRDRLDVLEKRFGQHNQILTRGLAVLGTFTAIAAFAGSKAGAGIIRQILGASN